MKEPPHPPRLIKNDTALSQDKSQRTTYDLYLAAIKEHGFDRADYTEFLEILRAKGWESFFLRDEVHKNEEELLSFERRLYAEYLDMSSALANPDLMMYPNPGQWTCPSCAVLPICQAMEEQGDVEYIRDSMFVVQEPRHEVPAEIRDPKWEGV
jgi:hypothetical protein